MEKIGLKQPSTKQEKVGLSGDDEGVKPLVGHDDLD